MTTTPEAAPDDLVAELRDFPAPEYIDGKPTCTHAESLIMQAADRIEALQAERNDILNGAGSIVGSVTDAAAETIAALESRLRLANECIEAANTIVEHRPSDETCEGCGRFYAAFDAKLAAWRKP